MRARDGHFVDTCPLETWTRYFSDFAITGKSAWIRLKLSKKAEKA
jgi:hypothetical protein